MSETARIAIFSEAFDTKGQDRETCLARVGRNTGNLAFFRGIQKLFRPDFLRPKLGLSEDPEKLEKLIDSLLAGDDFADFWTMRWCDALRVKSEFPINLWPNAVYGYQRRIRRFLKENEPDAVN